MHLVLLTWRRDGDLTFQIEMILPADLNLTSQRMGGFSDRAGRIAARHPIRFRQERLGRYRLIYGQDGRGFRILKIGKANGGAGRLPRLSHYRKQALAVIADIGA